MKIYLWLLCLLAGLLSAPSLAQNTKILGKMDCFSGSFSTYDGWMNSFAKRNPNASVEQLERFTGIIKRKFPEELYDKYKANLECEIFRYEYSGVQVMGYIIAPKEAKNLPTILYNRGGNGNFGAMVFTQMFNDLFALADNGFAIIGTQYRGVAIPDSPYQDEFGGADIQDVLALQDLFGEFSAIDRNRVGIMGYSRGGMQSMLTLKNGFETSATVLVAGVYDLKLGVTERPEMERVYAARIPSYASQKKEQLEARSALYWLDELDHETQFLLVSGDADERVNYKHSVTLHEKMQEQGFSSELIIYDGGEHALGSYRNELVQKVTDFFQTHL